MNNETERLVREVKKELKALRTQVEKKRNPKLLKTYQELLLTLT